MSYSLAQLKALQNESLDKIASKASSDRFKDDFFDDTFWQVGKDKAGNGSAIIRFLPQLPDEDLPWVEIFEHGYEGPGGWYIERSLRTIGLADPMQNWNKALWATGDPDDKELAKKTKARASRISNILVLSDPRNRDNEGKVFRFKYGQQIWEKIDGKLNPKFEGEARLNPFNPFTGSDFHLKVFIKDKFSTYSESMFTPTSSPICGGDDTKIQEVLNNLYPLSGKFLDPKYYKSYEALEQRLNKARKIVSDASKPPELVSKPRSTGDAGSNSVPPPSREVKAPPPSETFKTPWDDAETGDIPTDDQDDYYQKLLNQ